MPEPLNKTAVAQSSVALVIAITLIETVRDILSAFKPSKSESHTPYLMLRIAATAIVIALAIAFIWVHPTIADDTPARVEPPSDDAGPVESLRTGWPRW